MKEFFRKKIVGLKRNPQVIITIVILIACIVYTFSMSTFSQATVGLYTEAYEQSVKDMYPEFTGVSFINRNPAMYSFLVTLFSILLPISFLTVYKKGKVNKFKLSIVFVIIALMIVCDILFISSMNFYTGPYWGLEDIDGYYASAINITITHIVLMVITVVLIIAKPFYSALLNKINTTVDDEYDRLMDQKSEEELMLDLEDEN